MGKRSPWEMLGIAMSMTLLFSGGALAGDAWCTSTDDCGRQGDAAYKRHDYPSAIVFYQRQVQRAEEDLETCAIASPGASDSTCDSLPEIAYNHLALANLHAGHAAKAKMWLSVAPSGVRTKFNKRLVAHALATQHWPPSHEGDYWQYAGSGLWSTLKVVKKGHSYNIAFDGFWVTALGALGAPHTGSLEDLVPIRDGVAVLHNKEAPGCAVTARFHADRVELSDTEDCATLLGANVRAEGMFSRVSSSSE